MQRYQLTTLNSLSHCGTTSLNALSSAVLRADLYLIALQTDSNFRDRRERSILRRDGSDGPAGNESMPIHETPHFIGRLFGWKVPQPFPRHVMSS